MTRRILAGLRRAAIVVCGSAAAHDDLVRFGLADPARLRIVPNGIDPALLEPPPPAARLRAAELLPVERGVFDLLHVGNDIPRKRLDRLVDIVATLRKRGHWIRLVRVGSPLRPETRQRMAELAFSDIIELPFIERDVLRAVYARCDLLRAHLRPRGLRPAGARGVRSGQAGRGQRHSGPARIVRRSGDPGAGGLARRVGRRDRAGAGIRAIQAERSPPNAACTRRHEPGPSRGVSGTRRFCGRSIQIQIPNPNACQTVHKDTGGH